MTKKRKKLTPQQRLKKKLWKLCRQHLRLTQHNICYTCGALSLKGANWQTGHGIAKGRLPLEFQYDIRNLKPQCMRCNKWLGGMSQIFIAKLEREKEGLKFLKESCKKVDGCWEVKHITIDKKIAGGVASTKFLKEQIEILEKKIKPLLIIK